jgi:hypothetical protein
MHRMPIFASTLVLALAIGAGAPSAAHTYKTRIACDYCGAGYDQCMQTCDASIWTGAPPPLPPGRCNDYCAQGTNICDARRMPHHGSRVHHF